MATNNCAGAAVCGKHLDIDCMKLSKHNRSHNKWTPLGEKEIFHFSIGDGKIEIIKEISKKDSFKHYHPYDIISFSHGDCIDGQKIWGCSCEIPVKNAVGSSKVRSGAHSRQNWTVNGEFCYAV